MANRHMPHVEALIRNVLDGPGLLEPSLRRAAFERGSLPEPLAALVAKIHRHAWQVTDEDVAGARAAGWSEDQLFELIVCASVGASKERLDAGLRALETGGGR